MDTSREALLWEPAANETVRCFLCAHGCRIPEGGVGLCGVRQNREGKLFTLVYGRLVAENVDPIEKKPLFHLAPGSLSYSVATAGCNLRCAHCQNYSISQVQRDAGRIPGRYVSPEAVVRAAKDANCHSIAYTYTEPTIFFEYALDCMRLARTAGMRNVFVTNGYLSAECIEAAAPFLDAANVDLKAMRDDFYREICGGRLEPVLHAVRGLWEKGVWVEVTTLVIPGHNDSDEELREIVRFLRSLSPDIPWHVSGFHPTYRLLDAAPTSLSTLSAARDIGLEAGLGYVYVGNRASRGGEDTICPGCRRVVIGRQGFAVTETAVTAAGGCSGCGHAIPGLDMGGAP